jgi:hypothetical protein
MQDGGERKRDRSDESCDASADSEMTTAQMRTQASDASHAPFATKGTVRCFPIGMHSEFINGFVDRFVWCVLHTN